MINKIIVLMLMVVSLSGCMVYDDQFDCPAPKTGIKCQRASFVAEKIEHELTTESKPTKIIYVRG